MRTIYIVCIIALLGAMMVAPAAATTWDVYEGESIQDAIDIASDGDTVFVHAGTYSGTVQVDTPNLILKGEGADVVTYSSIDYYICVGSANPAPGCIIEGLKVVNSDKGLQIMSTSPDCIIRNCVFEGLSSNFGVTIGGENTTFMNNVVSNTTGDYSAVMVSADSCTIVNNTIKGSTGAVAAGILLYTSAASDNIVTKNNISSNGHGIFLYEAGPGNKIYLNNFVDNGASATTFGSAAPAVTYWNSTSPVEYTYGSTTYTNYLGNYWGSDYSGTDADGDGIGDTPYVVPDGLGSDNYPLMEPFENYPEVPAPDLTPTSIANDSLSAGVPAAITVDVSNIGSADAGSFNVSLKVEETVIGNDTVASLGAGSSVPVVFIWTPDAAGSFNLTAIVDSDDAVAESDEANNGLTREVTVEEPTPATPALISGNATYDNGNPVMNPAVTVRNMDTSENFTVKTAAGSNHYLTLTDSSHVSAGDWIRINASNDAVYNETSHIIMGSEIESGGFVQDMLLESGERPDLIVTEKSEEWVTVDKTYTITYTMENSGTFNAGATTTSIKIDGTEVATDPVPALAIGESHTSTLGPFMLSGDNDTIEVCADSVDVINELDETNNCLENLLEASGLPDLTIRVALKTPGYANEDNILGVRVKNTGTGDAGSFNVSLSIDGTPMPEQTVPSLTAGETTELEYAWTPTELGGHALSATVDTNNDVAESNETNNDYARTSVIISSTDWQQFHYDVVHTGFSPSGAPDTNETLWISDELSAIGGTSTVVADGKVFAYGGPTSPSGSGDGVLYGLDEFTGAILWNISIPTPAYGSWSSPAYHNGRVFTSTDIEAGCYNATTGEQIWIFENPTGEPSVGGGPIVADGKVIVNDWQAGHFYCLDEEIGELLWNFTETKTGGWGVGYAQGVPAYEDGKFYLTTWLYPGGNVYCVDADTGEEIWNQTTPLDTCGSPTVVDGTVYVTNYNFYGDGEIYAMDATDGSILWQQTIQRTDSTPAVAYGNVYVCGGCSGYSQMQTYCFNATTGNPIWSTDTGDEIGGWTCSVAVADGKVFVGHPDSLFNYAGTFALDAFTGDVIWSYPEGGSSPAVADNIVFTIGGGRVYAFYTSKPDLTVTAIETPTNLRNDVINPISATITNVGGSDAGSFDVSLAVDGTTIDTATIATLAAGENVTVELLWTPDTTGGATLTVTADASDAVTESDESNNNLSQSRDVLEKLTVTANVRVEGKNETVWTGDVTFSNSTIMASDGSIHYLNEPTALGALDEADRIGGFGYVAENSVYGLYVSEVNNEPPIGWDGWMYRVNYVSPSVGAPDYTLADSDEVLWYFGAWTAPPLAIELSATGVNVGEEFTATVTAYNGTSAEFEPVDNATVYAEGLTFRTGLDGNATLSLETAGDYTVYADKGTWANYTRSEKKAVTVLSVESYGESVYAKKNTILAWRALSEPDNKGAIMFRNARIAIELDEMLPACKNVSVWVKKIGFRTVSFDVAISSDGASWTTIGSETCNSRRWTEYDFSGDFGDVRYIRITKSGTRWKPRIMGLDAVYAKN